MTLRGNHKVHLLASPSGASYAPPVPGRVSGRVWPRECGGPKAFVLWCVRDHTWANACVVAWADLLSDGSNVAHPGSQTLKSDWILLVGICDPSIWTPKGPYNGNWVGAWLLVVDIWTLNFGAWLLVRGFGNWFMDSEFWCVAFGSWLWVTDWEAVPRLEFRYGIFNTLNLTFKYIFCAVQ